MMLVTAQRRYGVVIPIVAGIGNALMAQPMIVRLKEARPDWHITVVAKTLAMGEIFARCPAVDQVRPLGQGGQTRGLLRQLRPRALDLCLVPFPSNRWQYNFFALACARGSDCCTVIRLDIFGRWGLSMPVACRPCAEFTM